MILTYKQLDDIISALQGTCMNSVEQACIDVLGRDPTPDELGEAEEEVECNLFVCDECGWYCEMSEMSEDEEDSICTGCKDGR